MAYLSLQQVSVAYQKTNILEEFNLEIQEGELVSLLGPSGCGKTTTLRLIAGFLHAHEGAVTLQDQDYTNVPVNKRNFGFVFQNYALFPHMSVFDNVAFGLRQRKESKSVIKTKVLDMLDLVGLKGFENRFPSELSGGQSQRVAIARALVIEPDLLLFDEPLSNLDANLRVNMRLEIRRIQQELGITAVYVSHDQEECFSISDQVAIMNKGNIEQLSNPADIYHYPKTSFIADFIGFKNFITFDRKEKQTDGTTYYKADTAFVVADHPGSTGREGMMGAIRPEDITLHTRENAAHTNSLSGTIHTVIFLGRSYQYEVRTSLGNFTVNEEMFAPLQPGTEVALTFPPDKWVIVEKTEVTTHAG
ncbi:ABC transporter ATP-binding protein [Salibacterium aidingense]|uniref:ABC transporter ATP-binding protein n=1 Tax=Salibacterium aidingense TaxID=384933 RepID=UPI003BC28DA0